MIIKQSINSFVVYDLKKLIWKIYQAKKNLLLSLVEF